MTDKEKIEAEISRLKELRMTQDRVCEVRKINERISWLNAKLFKLK